MEEDPRIVLYPFGEAGDLIVDHPGQPADYVHTDGTLWTWQQRWRVVGGVKDERGGRRGETHRRVYDLVTPDVGPTSPGPTTSTEMVTVPRLAGMSIGGTTARATMAAAQGESLTFKIIHQTTQVAPVGMVFIQLPVFGSRVPAGSVVTLVVSDGPPPGQVHPPQL